MITKRFTITNVVTPSIPPVSVGNFQYGTYPTNNVAPMSSLISSELDGSFTFLLNVTATGITHWIIEPISAAQAHASIVDSVPASHTNTIALDYDIAGPILGIPTNAKIKKLVYRAPWSYSIDVLATRAVGTWPGSQISVKLERSLIFGLYSSQPTSGVHGEIGGVDLTMHVQASDQFVGSDGDHIVFDHTGTPDFITTAALVTDYPTIENILLFDSGESLWTATATLTGSTIGDTVSISAIVVMTFLPEWHVDVSFENEFSYELDSPPANQAMQSGNTIQFSSGADPDPLDFSQITALTVQPLNNGIAVGPAIPATFTATTNLLQLIIPGFADDPIDEILIGITSTQFTGTMALQIFSVVNFYNAPGIYTFVPGRTHDTYYNYGTTAPDYPTIDTKIPNPTGRTGFY